MEAAVTVNMSKTTTSRRTLRPMTAGAIEAAARAKRNR
jgi:hypothetical protein